MSITLTLIIVIMTSIISYQAFENNNMKQKLVFHPVSIKDRGEFYRFLTHGFLHGDLMHLIVNMYVLYTFGEQIEQVFMHENFFGPTYGRITFIVLYFGAIIFSSIPQYIRHQDNNYYRSLGASGGTSAIVFAYIIFEPWGWFVFPPLPGILLGIAFLFYSSYMDKKGSDNIGHNAHFWGAVFGFVFTMTMFYFFVPWMVEVFFHKILTPLPPPFLS